MQTVKFPIKYTKTFIENVYRKHPTQPFVPDCNATFDMNYIVTSDNLTIYTEINAHGQVGGRDRQRRR